MIQIFGLRYFAFIFPSPLRLVAVDLYKTKLSRHYSRADAEALLGAQRWGAAYYLLGYAVECGLKACAARQFRQDEVPDKTVVSNFYTHRLDQLLSISGVKGALEERARAEPAFQVNWNTVRDWNETSRYDHSTSEARARDMRVAVADPTTGVLTWLKTQW